MRVVKVVVIDDQQLVAEAVKLLLEAPQSGIAFEVVATAYSGLDGLEMAQQHQPELILVDLMMPNMHGLEVVSRLKRLEHKAKIVMLSGFAHTEQIAETRTAGCDGYIVKHSDRETFVAALEQVILGTPYFADSDTHLDASSVEALELTKRELQVLELLAEGYTNVEMAPVLNLSVRTVEKYRASLNEKFDTHSVSALLRRAKVEGLII